MEDLCTMKLLLTPAATSSGVRHQDKMDRTNGTAVFRYYPCLWSYPKGIICSKTARTWDELWRLIQSSATTIRQNGTLLEQCRVSGILDVTRLSHALRLTESIFSKLYQRHESVMSKSNKGAS